MKQLLKRALSLAVAVALLIPAIIEFAALPLKIELPSVRAADDYYTYVNQQWIFEAQTSKEAGKDLPSLLEMEDKAKKDLEMSFVNGIALERDKVNDDIGNMLALYKLAQDKKNRDADGLSPIKGYIDSINAVSNLNELADQIAKIPAKVFFCPSTTCLIYNDGMRYTPSLQPAPLAMKNYFHTDSIGDSDGQAQIIMARYYENLLMLAGETQHSAHIRAREALSVERQLAEMLYAQGVSHDASLLTITQICYNLFKIDFRKTLVSIVGEFSGQTANFAYVTDTYYFERLNSIFSEANISALKSYMLVSLLDQQSQFLSSAALEVYSNYRKEMRAYYDNDAVAAHRSSFDIALGAYPYAAGRLYYEQNYTSNVKQKVTDIAKHILKTYRERVINSNWVSETTKRGALRQLNTLKLQIAYPDSGEALDYLDGYVVVPHEYGGSLSGNLFEMERYKLRVQFSRLDDIVKDGRWRSTPLVGNAFYDPTLNAIVIPAAILRSPIYDPKQSASENYGSIGAVIGHEMSHAIDTTSFYYDENGVEYNWWSDEDARACREKYVKLVNQYFPGASDETINEFSCEASADLGSVAVALDAAKTLPDFDAEAFFRSFARSFRSIETGSTAGDSHPADIDRVNITLSNFDLFQQTYGMRPGDKMYRDSSERLQIW